ncbi:hypothetical protein [Streptomyces piniterrae]|nr:hypothetical protein [Streptomyces piniterrae]
MSFRKVIRRRRHGCDGWDYDDWGDCGCRRRRRGYGRGFGFGWGFFPFI